MQSLNIATAQFENKSGDKAYNLDRMDALAASAAESKADVICFHECSVHGYTFARELNRDELWNIAEQIPDGPSTNKLIEIAQKHNITVLSGLFERGDDGNIYKAHIAVNGDGVIAKFRKLHPFINSNITPGSEYCVFDLNGWKCGILICYDNNVIENVRATKLLGADIIFMPHVTMCTPSTRPGAGFVDPELWHNRHEDPTTLRKEFEGLKGREWLMKWLPARAYDNAVYAVFANPIGMDHDQLKNGRSMIIDPFGDVLAECTSFDDEIVIARASRRAVDQAGGSRYIKARRPDLYKDIVGQEHTSEQKVVWMK